MRRIARRILRQEIAGRESDAYLRGLNAGRQEAPRECGALQHHPSDFWYDPGQ